MRILQINAWQGRLARQLLPFIREVNPDIICLQEVYQSETDLPSWEHSFNLLSEISKLGYDYAFFDPWYSYQVADSKTTFGIAIVSKYPLEEQVSMFTHGHFVDNWSAENRIANCRTIQRATALLPDNKRLTIVNHHGHWDESSKGTPVSTEKMQLVLNFLDSAPNGPVVFCGDLNLAPDSDAMQLLNARFRNLTKEHTITTTLSELGKVHDVSCDYILTNDAVTVDSFSVSDTLVSDHKALLADIHL